MIIIWSLNSALIERPELRCLPELKAIKIPPRWREQDFSLTPAHIALLVLSVIVHH